MTEQKPRMPKLIRFVIVNSAIGVVIGWLVAAGLIWFNIGGFGELVWRSQQRTVALFILALSFGVTFGFAYLTTAVMLLPRDKDQFDKI
jgi:hypothetical protein